MIGFFLAALAPAVTATPVPAPAPAAQAKARWISDWADQRCSLIRMTGGEDGAMLMIRTVPGTHQAELWYVDPKWEGRALPSFSIVDFQLDPGKVVTEGSFAVTVKGYRGFAVTTVDRRFLADLPQAKRVTIRHQKRLIADIPLPRAGEAVSALRECERSVLQSWGFDPGALESLSRPARPGKRLHAYFKGVAYPPDALRERAWGSVIVRLTIGVGGAIEDCTIVHSSAHKSLGAATCNVLLARARFEPALGADGRPVRALSAGRIWWLLPN
jgi:TonB family protein